MLNDKKQYLNLVNITISSNKQIGIRKFLNSYKNIKVFYYYLFLIYVI